MNRVRDWQVLYNGPNGGSHQSTHSTRENAVESMTTSILLAAKVSWQCGKTEWAAPMLKACEELASHAGGNWLYVSPGGGRWSLIEI